MRMRLSTRGGLAIGIALVAVIFAGVMGTLAETAPGELACQWVAVGILEPGPGSGHPSADQAATAYAKSLGEIESSRFPGKLRVVDVTGSDTMAGDVSESGRVFAVRGHGRTFALIVVRDEVGGWVASNDYVC